MTDGLLPPDALPDDLRAAIGDAAWAVMAGGRSGAAVFRLTDAAGGVRYLKRAARGAARADLAAEAARLRWLAGKLPVPRVLGYGETADGGAALLLSAVPGTAASEPDFAGDAPRMVRLLAAGLRTLHALPVADCPFDHSLDVMLAAAGENVARGLVDEDDFDDERQGRTARDVYAELLATRPAHEDRVFTHGDYSLPNVMLDGDAVGFIDLGRGGVSDRHRDLALAARSLAYNWGEEWVPRLFAAYALAPVDAAKIAYYQLLDEFF